MSKMNREYRISFWRHPSYSRTVIAVSHADALRQVILPLVESNKFSSFEAARRAIKFCRAGDLIPQKVKPTCTQ